MKNITINRYSYLLIFTLLIFIFTGAMCKKEESPQMMVDQEIVKEDLTDEDILNNQKVTDLTYLYQNNTYGFRLQVPDNYQFSEKPGTMENFASFELVSPDPDAKPVGTSQMKPDSAKVILSMYEMPEGTLAMDYIPTRIHGNGFEIKDEEIGTIGNNITYRYQFVDEVGDAIEYLIEYPDGKIIQIIGYYGKGDNQPEIMEEIYRIQDSFRVN
ncbi:hypothetical protein KKC88_00270 [Patescibacteria group bacterium]|nr:hypothetical protein [Patescibacteria group bacterium]MBU1673429.1 hypothetical protein [Patescibacteria group bacterium]MBU1963370.1 hypothetical protein [Patescibacteria group bacterium]